MGGEFHKLNDKHIQIITTSSQEVDNEIITQVWAKPPRGPSGVRVIKITGNIGIYRTRVFHMRSGTNQ